MEASPAGSATAPARSPLLDLPGAVPLDGIDAGLAWHYGDPVGEQRAAERAAALFDRSTRDVLAVPGADRLSWLHTLTSQALTELADGAVTVALILSPQGHVEHHFGVTHLGDAVYLDTDAGRGEALLHYLESMRFWSDVQPALTDLAILEIAGPTAEAVATAAEIDLARRSFRSSGGPMDSFAGPVPGSRSPCRAQISERWRARCSPREPGRPGVGRGRRCRSPPGNRGSGWTPTSGPSRTSCPGWPPRYTWTRAATAARRPSPGCTTSAGRRADSCCCIWTAPPTRCPKPGDDVLTAQGRSVGRVGSVAHHHEYGPIALAMVKRTVQPGTPLLAGGVDAALDPDDATTEDGPPVSAIDRRTLPNLRRP